MLRETKRGGKNKNGARARHRRGCITPRGPTLFPGLLADARVLGVHRNHLYMVLSGRRTSHRLLAAYRALKS